MIFAWSLLIEPGSRRSMYAALAPPIGRSPARWAARRLYLAAYALGRRRPERVAVAFAGAVWLAYALLDVLAGLPMVPLVDLLTPRFALSAGGGPGRVLRWAGWRAGQGRLGRGRGNSSS